MAQESGLARRGFFLLALMAALVVAGWALLLRTPEQQLPPTKTRPEFAAPLVHVGTASFPGTVGSVVNPVCFASTNTRMGKERFGPIHVRSGRRQPDRGSQRGDSRQR